jgi:hypothetical protein
MIFLSTNRQVTTAENFLINIFSVANRRGAMARPSEAIPLLSGESLSDEGGALHAIVFGPCVRRALLYLACL